jgi:hypothetical protein
MAKVIKKFKDKNTKKVYRPGDEYENKDKKRIEELQKLGYLAASEKEDQKE